MHINLPRVTSITKKIVVALLGAFLLVFLAFHAVANLMLLSHDGGQSYSAFCHFMGSNVIVKVFELVLLGCLGLHILLTVLLWFQNRMARPVQYHTPSKSRKSPGSAIMILTGLLILICLGLHFYDFYLVKVGVVKGDYMVKLEAVQTNEVVTLQQASAEFQTDPATFMQQYEQQLMLYASQLPPDQYDELVGNLDNMKRAVPVVAFLDTVAANELVGPDHKWIKPVTAKQKEMLQNAIPGIDIEPDFYHMAHELFKIKHILFFYILFFVILWFHMRHAFQAAFQTLGLTNYKYFRAINIIGNIYAWCICLMFAAVAIGINILF